MRKYTKFMLIFSFLLISYSVSGQVMHVHIKNIHDLKGQLCIAVFTNESDFKAEKTFWETRCQKGHVVNGEYQILIPIQPGKYGISVLDDKNGDCKMEYNLFGIPREGFGFSGYYQKGIHLPHFSDFSFILEKNETKQISIIMKYF